MDHKELYDKLNDYLVNHQLKNTRQRDEIISTFFSLKDHHVSIDELLTEVRKRSPHIGYATVYRTLLLLVEAGIAHQRQFHDGQSRFEINTAHHHDHLICTACGKIVEFESELIEDTQEKIAQKHHFHLTGHKMELYGLCADCHTL